MTLERIASPTGLERTREALLALPVSLIAPGHGPCIRLVTTGDRLKEW